MKNRIWIFPYTLTPRHAPNSRSDRSQRHGCLLRIDFENHSTGYSDCFPWPELGDLPIEDQLNHLRADQWTSLTQRSIEFAKADAEAATLGKSLFQDLCVPPNHFLVTHLQDDMGERLHSITQQGFRLIKAKLGKNPKKEAQLIKASQDIMKSLGLKWRFDFNACLNETSAHRFLEDLGPAINLIDFVEDPTPFQVSAWSNLAKSWGVRLALDRMDSKNLNETFSFNEAGIAILVIKPACQNPEKLAELAKKAGIQVVVTSSMDHPLGQLGAAWCAGKIAKNNPNLILPGGLLSQSVYEENQWSHLIQNQGPHLIPPSLPGFGLRDELSELEWKAL